MLKSDLNNNLTEEALQRQNINKRLKVASALCLTFITVEVIGGIIAGSLTVLSDAAHLLADLASFAVALAASHLASLPATATYTFGLKRVEALAALFSVSSLALVSVMLAVEAVRRLWLYTAAFGLVESSEDGAAGPDVDGKLMTMIASIGVAVNVALALVLGEEGHSHSHSHSHHGHDGGHSHSHSHENHDEETSIFLKQQENGHVHCTAVLSNRDHGHGHSHDHNVAHCNHNQQHDHQRQHHSHHREYGSTSASDLEVLHCDELPPIADDAARHSEAEPRNINLHAAYLHVLGDLLQSIAVLIAGIVIWFQPTWNIVDPICTILFCMLVAYSTASVFRSSLSVLLEEVPPHLDWNTVYNDIQRVGGVSNVHCLHVWSVSHGTPALSVHVRAADPQQALKDIHAICCKYKIGHSTIQTQSDMDAECITCSVDSDQGKSGTCHDIR